MFLSGVLLSLGIFFAFVGIPIVAMSAIVLGELQRCRERPILWLPRWIRRLLVVEATLLLVMIAAAAVWSEPAAGANPFGFALGFMVLALFVAGLVGVANDSADPPPPSGSAYLVD